VAARIAHADNDAKECEDYKFEERQRAAKEFEDYKFEERQRAADKKEWRIHHANKVKATDSKEVRRRKRHACEAATHVRAAAVEEGSRGWRITSSSDLLAEWMEENPTNHPKKAAAAAETAGIEKKARRKAAKEAVETAAKTAAETAAMLPAKKKTKVEKSASAENCQVMQSHQHHVVQLRHAQYDFPPPGAVRRSARICDKHLDQLYK
jgi:hypothetical protein